MIPCHAIHDAVTQLAYQFTREANPLYGFKANYTTVTTAVIVSYLRNKNHLPSAKYYATIFIYLPSILLTIFFGLFM